MVEQKKMRADAAANRARIVAAARELYAELGPSASFDGVATRAGVGNATLYRHFPNATALHSAIYAQRLDESSELLAELASDPDAWSAFARFLSGLAENPDVGLLDIIRDEGTDAALLQRRDEVRAQVRGLLDRAMQGGGARPDLTIRDLDVVGYALTRVGVEDAIDAESRERFTRILLDGLKAGSGDGGPS